MCVLYLFSKGTTLKKDHNRIRIEKYDGTSQTVPLKDIDSIVAGEGVHITSSVIEVMLDKKTLITFLDFRGKVRGHLCNDSLSWHKAQKQWEKFNDATFQLQLARLIMKNKLANQRKILRYYCRARHSPVIGKHADYIKSLEGELNGAESVDELMGIEGIAAKTYFDTFSIILDSDKWEWAGRKQRPATDPINALLNYGYAFLEKEVRIAIAGAGLDPRFGFIHSNNGRKDSLVYDLMEMFRQPIIDRFTFSLVNLNQLSPSDFQNENGISSIGPDSRSQWINCFEQFMMRPYADFNGKSPRDWIRQKIHDFAIIVLDNQKTIT